MTKSVPFARPLPALSTQTSADSPAELRMLEAASADILRQAASDLLSPSEGFIGRLMAAAAAEREAS